MDIGFLVTLTVFGGTFLGIMAIYSLLVQEPRLVRERIERYDARVVESIAPSQARTLLKERRFSAIGWMDRFLKGTSFAERLALDLARAGVPLRVGEYILIRWISALIVALSTHLLTQVWFVPLAAGLMGSYIPKFYLGYQRRKRVSKVVDQLMDAVSMIANSLKAGYSFGQGLEVVTKEMPAPIAEEFHQVLAEMNLGGSPDEALNNLTKRVPSYDIDLLATALIIQRQVGGNLAEVLEKIAYTIRDRIRILGEVRTRTSQARLSGYVIGLMPFFLMAVITLLSPAYLKDMVETPLGMLMLIGAFTMELIGFVIMKRIVAIEV